MFEGIRSLFGRRPRRSELDLKLDEALAGAESLDHYFFFSDYADAEAAAGLLEQRGWSKQSIDFHGAQQKWLLQVRQPAVPGKPEDLHDLQAELDLFADEHHGEYDGWKVPNFLEPE